MNVDQMMLGQMIGRRLINSCQFELYMKDKHQLLLTLSLENDKFLFYIRAVYKLMVKLILFYNKKLFLANFFYLRFKSF